MASSAIGVRVEGLGSVVRSLQQMGVEVEDLKAAMKAIAEEVKPDYVAHAPVRTGRLRGDFRTANAKGKSTIYVGRASVPYAGPINFGWAARGIAPANFIAKGDATAAPKAAASLEDAISSLVQSLDLG